MSRTIQVRRAIHLTIPIRARTIPAVITLARRIIPVVQAILVVAVTKMPDLKETLSPGLGRSSSRSARTMRSSSIFVIVLLVAHLGVAQEKASLGDAPAAESAEVVQMQPYGIIDFGWRLGFSVNKLTGKIRSVKFTRVETWSAASKAGLRADDYLMAVDGVAVVGMKYADFPALLNRSIPPGQSTQYSFTVARGLKNKRTTTTVTLSIKAKEMKNAPNQSSKPIPADGLGG